MTSKFLKKVRINEDQENDRIWNHITGQADDLINTIRDKYDIFMGKKPNLEHYGNVVRKGSTFIGTIQIGHYDMYKKFWGKNSKLKKYLRNNTAYLYLISQHFDIDVEIIKKRDYGCDYTLDIKITVSPLSDCIII